MVRLLPARSHRLNRQTQFQFLNGTIITKWAINPDYARAVSIPQWYDYYSNMPKRLFTTRSVSIPQWYDYYQKCINFLNTVSMFQFLNGTIITNSSTGMLSYTYMFQFLNGTIITRFCSFTGAGRAMFQFLNGTIITCSYRLRKPCSIVSIPQWYDYYSKKFASVKVSRITV